MSTFSQFTGGNRIKSIQRGEITLSGESATATIASVDTAKTELRMLGYNYSSSSHPGAAVPKISLTSSTAITATRGIQTASVPTTVSWELTEFI